MRGEQVIFLVLATFVIFFLVLVGIMLAEGRPLFAIGSLIASSLVMGSGFVLRKRLREKR